MNAARSDSPAHAAGRSAHARSASECFPLGAHLVTPRRGYVHHGIYVGAGRVVHYAGLSRSLLGGPVEEVSLERFAAGRPVSVKRSPSTRYAGAEVVARARSRIGEDRYRLITNNCEHFCAWCVSGDGRSEQVEMLVGSVRGAASRVSALFSRTLSLVANRLAVHRPMGRALSA